MSGRMGGFESPCMSGWVAGRCFFSRGLGTAQKGFYAGIVVAQDFPRRVLVSPGP